MLDKEEIENKNLLENADFGVGESKTVTKFLEIECEKCKNKIKFKLGIDNIKNVEKYIEQLETDNKKLIKLVEQKDFLYNKALSELVKNEKEKQKLIVKLEEESNQFDEETKEMAIEMNKAREFVTTDEYEEVENEEYILNLEEKYEKLNIKRIRTNEILQIVKGEKEWVENMK